MFEFLVWHALIVTASCELFKEESGYVLNYAPVYNTYKPRDYQFNYAVSDPHTGDHKSQWEVKTNGVVRGGYSLLEPDGTTRIVEYIADHDGFRAVVNKVGTAVHPVTALVPQVPPVSHYRAYDGQVANYIPQLQEQTVPQIGQTVGHQGLINLNQGGTEGVVLQSLNVAPEQSLGALGVGVVPSYNLEGIVGTAQGGVPIQGHNFEEARLVSNSNIQLGTAQQVPLQGYNIEQPNLAVKEEVPLQSTGIAPQNIQFGTVQQVPPQVYNIQQQNLAVREEVPLQPTGIVPQNIQGGEVQFLQGQELRPEVLPNIQGQVAPTRIEALLPVQGYELGPNSGVLQGHLQHEQVVPQHEQIVPVIRQDNLGLLNLGRGNLSPLQGQLARVPPDVGYHGVGPQNVGVPLERQNFGRGQQELPQPQIEIVGPRGVPQVPGLVPVDPSYQTVIDYQSLGSQGLPNDNRLKKDVYHSSYSEKVLKVVPAPRKAGKKVNKEFLIYYPEH